MNRRFFLRGSGVALAAIGAWTPAWLARAAEASTAAKRRKTLVVLFQRGAMDGLNAVIPFRDARYAAARPTIAVPQPIDLDGQFGLHPSLAPLHGLWKRSRLAIVHAAGSPDASRSHFDAQDYMESGTPGLKSTREGWLNRALGSTAEGSAAAATPLRAVGMGPRLARMLRGPNAAVAIAGIGDFKLREGAAREELESMYTTTADPALAAPGREAFEAMKLVTAIDRQPYTPAGGAEYPATKFGASLRQIARLIKADAGVEIAFADMGGWDTHTAESQRLPALLADFGGSIAALCADLEERLDDVLVVTMSEFGRTVRENGGGGTDHGHANAMFIAGGGAALRGGKVHGAWPGLEPEQLFEGRDLAVTTDFRTVLGEVLTRHLGLTDLARVFPGAPAGTAKRLGLMA